MKTKKVTILAATFSGNKGAAAMLQSIILNLKSDVEFFNVLSVYPKEDRKQNPHQNVRIISAKPEEVIFITFPLALLYYLVSWIKPLRKLLLKNKLLVGFYETDLTVDAAGISFVDSRGIVMNTYNFMCIAIPVLLGKEVVKFSQAMGPFDRFWNRTLAKIVLPKVTQICARGEVTMGHLKSIGLNNIKLCADGAFSMKDSDRAKMAIDNLIRSDEFYSKPIVSVSISSVVEKYCSKVGIDYIGILAKFIDYLIEEKKYGVLIISNAAREGKHGKKNNDLIVCQDVYDHVSNKAKCRYYSKEFTPEEIREMIGLSNILVASRFHAMIGGLHESVPVLLVGWSHKYKEVLDMFDLSKYASDYKNLNFEDLVKEFNRIEIDHEDIIKKIQKNLPQVKGSSYNNIEIIKDILRVQ
ncbi:polysaccharide pyruvyl transferase family protein [Paenibacillus lentus]|uniref:polysaccharide pyruvyl transferase family protein n=1 Tax=Paenibacillus lentus TaxID=1338368 RepID=UPI0036474E49